MATKYGQAAIDYWNDRKKRRAAFKKILGVVVIIGIAVLVVIYK